MSNITNKNKECIIKEALLNTLKQLNKTFNNGNKVRDTDRSLFFSGLMIALTNANFRNTYKVLQAPTKEEVASTKITVLEAHHLNKAIVEAIYIQLKDKINNLSKEFNWRDRFSFIKNIDYSLIDYKKIIETIENKIFKPFKNEEKQDILGQAYKVFLSRAGKTDNKNIILTPDHIKSLMVRLARLSVDDVVIDTCTGSGGFLMEAMETMITLAKQDDKKIKNIKNKQLIGFEIDAVLFALACSNMFLHGDGRTNLLYRSSLLSDNNQNIVNNNDTNVLRYIRKLKPTVCVINPPYENNNSIKFVNQALDYLEKRGKLIVIMPTPTLTQNQDKLTKDILLKAKLDFVIKMPLNLFSEQKRTVNTSIFGFTKTPHDKEDDVIFYNLEDDGFVSIQHKGKIDKNNTWKETENQIVDCLLNSKEIFNICEKRKIYKKDKLNCAGISNNKVNNNHEIKQISELFNIEKGSLASGKAINGQYKFITASDDFKKHNNFSHDTEAIVFVVKSSGSLGKSHYIKGQFIASNLCIILTPKNKKYPINLQFYNGYFNKIRKKLVSDLSDGTSKLTISENVLKKYYIEYIPIEEQNNIHNLIEKHDSLQQTLKDTVKEIDEYLETLV